MPALRRHRWQGYVLDRARAAVCCCLVAVWLTPASASTVRDSVDGSVAETAAETAESPWLLTPVLSSNPKLGTSFGGMAAYIKQFHPQAPPSTFGGMATYSTTDSYAYGVFARAYLGPDKHRIALALGGGKANNRYENFLGSGLTAETTDQINALYGSYLMRVSKHWYVGGHAVVNRYGMFGGNEMASLVLDALELGGVNSNAVGLKAQYDTRDNTQSPGSGSYLRLSQLAYREALGGDVSFDIFLASFSRYLAHGRGSVLATNLSTRMTGDAPPSGYSTLRTRGYIPGEFRAPNSLALEVEERHYVAPRWRLAAFASLSCLFDDAGDCSEEESLYPAVGFGVHFVIRPEDKMIVRLDAAWGEAGSHGVYMSFGQAF